MAKVKADKKKIKVENKKAFTLIELLLVCTLIVILSSFALPQLLFISKASLTRELDGLYSTCIYLQQKAMATNKNQDLVFDTHKNSYIYNGRSNKQYKHIMPSHISFGFIPKSKGPPSRPEKAIQKAITFPQAQPGTYHLTFFPDATTSSGTVYLTNTDKTEMVALTCPIASISFIRKYRYTNTKWLTL